MACPDCDSPAGDLRFATSVETHGLDCGPYETFNEEFIVCRECGGRYDVCEWDATQALREIRILIRSHRDFGGPTEPTHGWLTPPASHRHAQRGCDCRRPSPTAIQRRSSCELL
jgi:hypothetical protein